MLRHKTTVLLIAVLVLSSLVFATPETNPEEMFGSILNNFWLTVNPFASASGVDPAESADIFGWYNGTFFGLAQWERDVCLLDLSADVRSNRDEFMSAEGQRYAYTTTVTASANKVRYGNVTYYEASWYIMPFDADAHYVVYLDDGKSKLYLKGTDREFVPVRKLVGANGYDVKYADTDYSKIVLKYYYDSNTGENKTF